MIIYFLFVKKVRCIFFNKRIQSPKKLRIYTATGILISEYELTESDRQKTLDIENFAKGIYLVELLYRDNNTQVEKLAVMD